MCLAIPAKVVYIDEDGFAKVDIIGTETKISTELTPDVKVGDFVLVHAGFSIEVIDENNAKQTLEIIEEIPDFERFY